MTPIQKDFRRIMKELENEGKIPKQYNYKKKRAYYKKLVSIIFVVLLIWNRNTLYLWIAPHFSKSIDSYNILSPIRYDTSLVSNVLIQSQHKAINNYLSTGRMLNEKLSVIIKRIYKRTGDGDKYSVEEIHNELKELEIFKEEFSESKFVEYRLNDLYLENISITEEMLNNLDKSNKELYSLRENYSVNVNQIQNAIIEFLEGNKIRYEIGTDQTITYYLIQPENNATNKEPEVPLANNLDTFESMENIAVGKLTYKDISYKWEYPIGVSIWEYKLQIPVETVNHYKSIDRNDIDDYGYYVTHEADDEYLSALANVFKTTNTGWAIGELPIELKGKPVTISNSLEELEDEFVYTYKDYFVQQAIIEFDEFEIMISKKGNKPHYIPNKNELLKYSDEMYIEKNKEYKALLNYVSENFFDGDIEEADELCEDIHGMCQFDFNVQAVFNTFTYKNISFNGMEQTNEVMQLVMNLSNNIRIRENNGFTPNEIFERFEKPNLKPLPDKHFVIKKEKIGRNDSCPCGSGKKYKKCCVGNEEM